MQVIDRAECLADSSINTRVSRLTSTAVVPEQRCAVIRNGIVKRRRLRGSRSADSLRHTGDPVLLETYPVAHAPCSDPYTLGNRNTGFRHCVVIGLLLGKLVAGGRTGNSFKAIMEK